MLESIRSLVRRQDGKSPQVSISSFKLSQSVDLLVFSGRVQTKFKLTGELLLLPFLENIRSNLQIHSALHTDRPTSSRNLILL